jgi:hypothetical protein
MDAMSEPAWRQSRLVPLQPMAMGDLLDGAFKLLRAKLGTIMPLAAAFLVPFGLLSVFLARLLVTPAARHYSRIADSVSANGAQPSQEQLAQLLRAYFGLLDAGVVSFLPVLLAAALTGAAVSRVVAAGYLGEDASAGAALRATGRRLPALLGAFVLVHLCEGIAGLFCLLPALVPMTFFLCATPAIMLEGLGAVQGMGRSASLVRSRFWRVLGIGLLSGLVAVLMSMILRWPFDFLARLAGPNWSFIPSAVGGTVTQLVVMPFTSIVATLVYLDARVRLEGLDLQMLSRDQGQRDQGHWGQSGGASLA